jgi:DNA adenine methylase
LLYLNRTCFKGNWRQNSKGQFNIGYGGQSRRWVITLEYLEAVSKALMSAELLCSDFEAVVEECAHNDFIFLDPPYQPGERELTHDHYGWKAFSFDDHERLAQSLGRAKKRGVRWCMTTSAHMDVLGLFRGFWRVDIPSRGHVVPSSGEALVLSWEGANAEVLR